ncbi:uncharacterized protein MONBRDRAFT_37901 [Monosiga brevicollis MX1]|uniref:Uncharacterized protein n=1 Tax=Monosiga brevicollis TaxID=81824 RepID=A9V4H9_MONBE|nr:uncharacterized protein MONBRDRAFT_37901 [Monosiga brevicollis MX1]EDQ87617.1 predicted protein [Monosiga brevicollis MX1]|eukprot:XP_001747537.1 hypothetical protein [Monosiga brevicollis MX1]
MMCTKPPAWLSALAGSDITVPATDLEALPEAAKAAERNAPVRGPSALSYNQLLYRMESSQCVMQWLHPALTLEGLCGSPPSLSSSVAASDPRPDCAPGSWRPSHPMTAFMDPSANVQLDEEEVALKLDAVEVEQPALERQRATSSQLTNNSEQPISPANLPTTAQETSKRPAPTENTLSPTAIIAPFARPLPRLSPVQATPERIAAAQEREDEQARAAAEAAAAETAAAAESNQQDPSTPKTPSDPEPSHTSTRTPPSPPATKSPNQPTATVTATAMDMDPDPDHRVGPSSPHSTEKTIGQRHDRHSRSDSPAHSPRERTADREPLPNASKLEPKSSSSSVASGTGPSSARRAPGFQLTRLSESSASEASKAGNNTQRLPSHPPSTPPASSKRASHSDDRAASANKRSKAEAQASTGNSGGRNRRESRDSRDSRDDRGRRDSREPRHATPQDTRRGSRRSDEGLVTRAHRSPSVDSAEKRRQRVVPATQSAISPKRSDTGRASAGSRAYEEARELKAKSMATESKPLAASILVKATLLFVQSILDMRACKDEIITYIERVALMAKSQCSSHAPRLKVLTELAISTIKFYRFDHVRKNRYKQLVPTLRDRLREALKASDKAAKGSNGQAAEADEVSVKRKEYKDIIDVLDCFANESEAQVCYAGAMIHARDFPADYKRLIEHRLGTLDLARQEPRKLVQLAFEIYDTIAPSIV